MTTRYRKKPIEVDAVQFILGESTKAEMLAFVPEANIGAPGLDFNTTDVRWFVIPTLEGDMHVSPDDWIIRGVNGEHYPCKPDIFAATYEAVA